MKQLESENSQPRSSMRRKWLISVALAFATLMAFGEVRECDFINYDDDYLVTKNEWVRQGLSWQSVVWAFTDTSVDWWHPLTWLSHMLDVQLFGMNPRAHHLVNVALHIANTILLFGVLARMTGGIWQSAFVAALFALHPLHVESVAWVSERKGVLSSLFWMLGLWAYHHYAKQPSWRRYLLVVTALGCGLMAKPMLITVPFVLLLLDYWPLRRFSANLFERGNLRLVVEKLPMIFLVLVSTVVTYLGQQHVGGMAAVAELPMHIRLANALDSYAGYLAKMFWPAQLAVFYPYPTVFTASRAILWATLLSAITVFAIRLARRHPYLIVGWLWYLGTLVPVIGLVQVSDRAMADRYTYIPLVGVFLMLAWGIGEWAVRLRIPPKLLAAAAAVVIGLCAVVTQAQVRHWRNSITLFEHALAVTTDNYIAHQNLGVALVAAGKPEQAIRHYRENLRINPRDRRAHYNIGVALAQLGRFAEAMAHYTEALRLQPDFFEAHHNLAVLLAREERLQEAVSHYRQALRLQPDMADTHFNLGNALRRQTQLTEAVFHYREAVRLQPKDLHAHTNLALTLAELGETNQAIAQLQIALTLDPGFAPAQNALASLRQAQTPPP